MEEELSEKDMKLHEKMAEEMAEEISKQEEQKLRDDKKVFDELRDMKLHKIIPLGQAVVQKVIGGWIYWRGSNGVFVPEPNIPPKQN